MIMISPHLIDIDVYLDKIKPWFGDSQGFFFGMTQTGLIPGPAWNHKG